LEADYIGQGLGNTQGKKIENFQYRHAQIKEILKEIEHVLDSKNPELKDKFSELNNYIRSRESKIDGLERANLNFKKEKD
jgi:sugar-specific transcriptional regulator TrmB